LSGPHTLLGPKIKICTLNSAPKHTASILLCYSSPDGDGVNSDNDWQCSGGRPVKGAPSRRRPLRHGFDTGVRLLLGPRLGFADTGGGTRHRDSAAVRRRRPLSRRRQRLRPQQPERRRRPGTFPRRRRHFLSVTMAISCIVSEIKRLRRICARYS